MDINKLLTSKEILNKKVFEKPYILLLKDFKCFEDLYQYRNMIRDLQIVPIKSDDMQKKYHSIDTKTLLEMVDFSDSNILFLENQFPYLLPKDVSQNIIWIKNETSEQEVNDFIKEKIKEIGSDVILFERSTNTTTTLVKGSFPHIRHIHIWYKL